MKKIKFLNMHYSVYYVASFILIILGALIYIYLILNPSFNDFSFKINNELAPKLGDTITGLVGTLFSLAGILLIVETLKSQNLMFQFQRFESKYFELIKIHRSNVDNLKKLFHTENTLEGTQVFVEIFDELKIIIRSIDKIFLMHNIEIEEIDKGGIAYTILYFGIGDRSKIILNEYFNRHYLFLASDVFNKIIDELKFIKDNQKESKYRFVGHQIRLGHYYRHLYQTIKYVSDQKFFSETEAYEYVKIIRAQLSTFEQSLLFFNSLSILGQDWRTFEFIQTFQLIKNLPPEFTFDFNAKNIYPKIKFEYQE